MVKIRLARFGSKHNPQYRIVVADSRSPRSGGYIENLGHYDPRKKTATWLKINHERYSHWLGNGAIPTETVARLAKQG